MYIYGFGIILQLILNRTKTYSPAQHDQTLQLQVWQNLPDSGPPGTAPEPGL